MADKTASIKVDLKGDEAKAGIRSLGTETKKTAGEMGSSLKGAFSEGMKGGVDAVKSAFGTIKSTILSIGGIAGGLGFAEIQRQALEANSKFGDLAAGIKFAGGSAKDASGIIKQLQTQALLTAHDSMQLVDVFEGIRRETGSIDYATDSIEDVAVAARGAHKSLESMGSVAGTLNEKFGITAEELPDALADVIGLSEKGGVQFEDMSEKLGLIGAYAKEAGLQGRGGLQQIVGMLNLADNANGSFKKGITAVGGLLESLGNAVGRNKIGAALGLSQQQLGGNATQQIEAIMKATKGQKSQLEKAFGGEQLKLLVDLGKTYSSAFDDTKGDVKTKTAAAVEAVRKAFADAGSSAVSWADIQNEAKAEMEAAPQKIATATEKLRQAFQSEKFQAALSKVIDKLPALADGLAKLLDFVVDHPGSSAALLGMGTFAKGGIEGVGGVIEKAIMKGFEGAGPGMAKAMAGSAAPFASSLAPLMGPIGLALGASLAIMLLASLHQAEIDKQKRKGEAEDAQRMLKGKAGPMGGAYQAAGALEAATGIEFDPSTAISEDTAGRATAGLDEHDKVMQERLLAKAKGSADMLKFGNKLAANHPEWFQTETNAQGVSPAAASAPMMSGSVSTSSTTAKAPDPQAQASATASAIASKTINVYVKNAKDIGGGGGAGSGPTGGGFVVPGYVVRQ